MSSSVEFSTLESPQKLFILLLFVFIWFQGLSVVTTTLFVIQGGQEFDPFFYSLLLITFTGAVVTFFAIFNSKPPYHKAIYPAAIANLILAADPVQFDVLNALFSFLLLYLAIRHPFEYHLQTGTFRSPQPIKKKKR